MSAARLKREIKTGITKLYPVEPGDAMMLKMMSAGIEADLNEVESFYEQAASSYNGDPVVLALNYCIALHSCGATTKALEILRSSIERFPGESELYIRAANCAAEIAQYTESVEILQMGLKLKQPLMEDLLLRYHSVASFIDENKISQTSLRTYLDLLNSLLRKERLVFSTQSFGVVTDGDDDWVSNVINTGLPSDQVIDLNDEWIDLLMEADIDPSINSHFVTRFA
ncbi:MAG: hypothetical protein AB7U71_23010 [Comamonas sp.]